MDTNTFTPNTGTRAHSRTFNVLTVDRECGVTISVEYNTVKLTRTEAGLLAEIDGQVADTERAVRLLKLAERVWLLEEVLLPVIGNKVACELHREMGRLGYREHYQMAADVLGRTVASLASLTASERDLVREYAYGQLGLLVGGVAA